MFCGHTKQSTDPSVYISISTFPKSSWEGKAVWINHSKYYQKQSALSFLMIQSALRSTVSKCLSGLCHTLNVTVSCSYTVSTATVLVLLMVTDKSATDIIKKFKAVVSNVILCVYSIMQFQWLVCVLKYIWQMGQFFLMTLLALNFLQWQFNRNCRTNIITIFHAISRSDKTTFEILFVLTLKLDYLIMSTEPFKFNL